MKPTEVLMQEHRIIEQVLTCLEVIATQAEADGRIDTDAAAQAVDFFGTFADRCHHGKEETLLFPMLETKGLAREGGPTGVMMREHDEGRGHLRAMAEAIQNDSQTGLKQFVDHARAFLELLRQHIQKEDSCLFAMADQILGTDDQQDLMAAFARVEHEDLGPETHTKYVELANRLADRLGVQKSQAASGAAESPCCHHGTGSS